MAFLIFMSGLVSFLYSLSQLHKISILFISHEVQAFVSSLHNFNTALNKSQA